MLSTLPYVNSLNPKYSKHTRCISCSQPENQFHWLYCTHYNNITKIIQNTITQFAFSEIPDITALQIQQLHTDLFNHNCLKQHGVLLSTHPFFLLLFMALFQLL